MSAEAKQLRIQTGVVSRTFKEKSYYEKEIKQFEDKLKNANFANEEEEYRAKMIPQQIEETKAAHKDTCERLSDAVTVLRKYVTAEGVDESTKEWIAANDKLKEVDAAITSF